jgi:hypothetical protein
MSDLSLHLEPSRRVVGGGNSLFGRPDRMDQSPGELHSGQKARPCYCFFVHLQRSILVLVTVRLKSNAADVVIQEKLYHVYLKRDTLIDQR